MPMGGALINIEKVLFDALKRNGRVAVIVNLTKHDKAGDLVDVVCDEGDRECEAKIVSLEKGGGGQALIQLVLER